MASLQGQMSVLAVLVAVLVAACSSASSTTAPTPSLVATPTVTLSPTPSVTAAPLDSLGSASKKALAAYRAMWRAYETAIEGPDPTYPGLSDAATGQALNTLVTGLKLTQKENLKGTGSAKLNPHPTEIGPVKGPTKVMIQDCLDDSATHVVNAIPGGKPYKDTPGGRRLTLATVTRQSDGVWKVSSFAVRSVGSC